ncbi:MAG: phosphopantothenoylcysteine decarboxylase [Rariglobus sp.]
MRILITSGATREPIDAVRFLSNVSTGRTGALIADALARHGHAVTLLHGEGAIRATDVASSETFSSTENLQAQLRRLLATGEFDAVIHCAAVSDYRPAETREGKLTSYAPELTLRLVPTPKLLPELKHYSPRPLKVVGFKLTAGADAQDRSLAVSRLFAAGTVDAVIHNDMNDLADGDARPFHAYSASHAAPQTLAGVPGLSRWLQAFLVT